MHRRRLTSHGTAVRAQNLADRWSGSMGRHLDGYGMHHRSGLVKMRIHPRGEWAWLRVATRAVDDGIALASETTFAARWTLESDEEPSRAWTFTFLRPEVETERSVLMPEATLPLHEPLLVEESLGTVQAFLGAARRQRAHAREEHARVALEGLTADITRRMVAMMRMARPR